MTAEPKEPRTAAGKEAETTLPHFDTCAGMRGPNTCDCGVVRTILAIEEQATAEARRELLAALRTGVEGLRYPMPDDHDFLDGWYHSEAVLNDVLVLIDDESPE